MSMARPTTLLFNSPVEIGLRALVLLNESFPSACTLQRLVILDYFVVHSDDLPDGPIGLHPKTPHRSGEILVRRRLLQAGLMLFHSRGLLDIQYSVTGVEYVATERSTSFLDSLDTDYIHDLRIRAAWLQLQFATTDDEELQSIVRANIGVWGAEFELESLLIVEDEIE